MTSYSHSTADGLLSRSQDEAVPYATGSSAEQGSVDAQTRLGFAEKHMMICSHTWALRLVKVRCAIHSRSGMTP